MQAATLAAATGHVAPAFMPAAHAADGVDLFPLSGFISSIAISGDGSVTVTTTQVGGSTLAVTHSGGDSTVLQGTVPGHQTIAYAVNFDGSVIVGSSYALIPSLGHATMWTAGGSAAIDLHAGPAFDPGGSLDGYTNSSASGVSTDGSVVVGYAGGPVTQAFRWTQTTGMVGLGFLPGYDWSSAVGVSGDGQIVAGAATSSGSLLSQAAYWTQGSGWTGLGFLPGGTTSFATAISRDGHVIVGSSENSAARWEAFRWTQGEGMEGLGAAPGGNFSRANAVNADGSVVVGETNTTTDGPYLAMRWTREDGMQTLASILNAGGVQLGDMTLLNATGVSDDGKIVVGYGQDASNAFQYFIARCESAACIGLITPEQLANSYAGQAAIGHTANAAIGGTLGTMQEYATQARASQGSRSTAYSVFAYGAYDTDPVTSGTLGITVDITRDIVVGLAASAARVETEMIYDGEADMRGGGLSAFVAHVPDAGLQLLAGVNGLRIDGVIERGYMNGVGRGFSKGNSSSDGFGFIGRVGWTEQFGALQLTPFASYTYAETTLDAYAERDGVFAASFERMTSTAETARFGADARYTFRPDTWAWGTLAWGHRLDGGEGADITATLGNSFPMSVAGVAATENWLEVGGGVRLPAWQNSAVTASVTASVPENEGDTTYLARMGLSQDF